MEKEKPLEHSEAESFFSSDAADWLNTFKKHFSIAFQDIIASLPGEPDDLDFQKAAIAAMSATLRDSGLSEEHLLAFLGEALDSAKSPSVKGTQDLKQRRIDLIDRKIAGDISYDEKIELATLTNALRAKVSEETMNETSGARELHAKLKAMDSKLDRS